MRYERSADRAARAAVQRETGVGDPRVFAPRTRALTIRDGAVGRRDAARAARPARGRDRRAEPDRAHERVLPARPRQRRRRRRLAAAAVELPRRDRRQRARRLAADDRRRPPGRRRRRSSRCSTRASPTATAAAARARPSSTSRRTVTCRRSPDFRDGDFVAGYDFVDDDSRPNDENGHGTHVAGTIGEGTGDDVGVTGLAYGARIMPVRVLDRLGEGDSVAISSGIRFAARKGADVINLSFEFGTQVTRAEIPDILAALRYARRKGVAGGRRLRQRRGAQHRLPRARLAGAVGRRDDPARLRRGVLQQRRQPRHRRPRRRRGRAHRRRTPTAGPTSGPAATSSR